MDTPNDFEFNRRLFTVAEAADRLRISKTMLFKLLRKGKLRPTKIGTRTLISGAAIDQMLLVPVE